MHLHPHAPMHACMPEACANPVPVLLHAFASFTPCMQSVNNMVTSTGVQSSHARSQGGWMCFNAGQKLVIMTNEWTTKTTA